MDAPAANGAPAPSEVNGSANTTGETRGRGNRGRRGGGAPGRGGNPRPRGREGGARGGSQQGQRQGRGGPGRPQQANRTSLPIPPTQDGGGPDDQKQEVQRSAQQTGEEEDLDVELCFICASPVIHSSLSPCNHSTCHICALRMRALYKNRACLHCRTNAETVIFTDNPEKRFDEFADADFAKTDDNLGIKFQNEEIFEDTVLLLRYNCPDSDCDVACYGWPDLHRHVRNVHHKMMCDLCTRNKKVFTHEHTLFTRPELLKHERSGDDNPGAVDQSGFRGHPECGFCNERFYGDDELYAHCRDKHERCHICDRRNNGRQQQYYLNYDSLEVHFKKDHFACPDQECLEKKFVVFESEMDLKAHQLEAHPNGLTKDARRDARRVDMSSFDYRQPHQEQRGTRREGRGGGREGRGGGRGRDPNVDAPLPVSSAQPMRRDEVAYQRQLNIHSAQSVSTRSFGGQLTSGDAYAARAPGAPTPATVSAPRTVPANPVPALNGLNLNREGPAATAPELMTAQDQARALRHAVVTERASNLLGNSAPKLTIFRNTVSSYRNGGIKAANLIDSFFALFDTSSTELGTLVKELAEIFEVPGKKDELLKAWNDWKAINEDYPSLPGPQGLPPGASSSSTSSAGKRILRLKTSTAQSSRSAVNQQAGWGSLASKISTPSGPTRANPNNFPSLPPANRTGNGKVTTMPWGTTTASSSSAASSARPTPAPSRPTSTAPGARPNNAAFPSLPAASKPGMNMSRPGYFGNPTLKVRSGTSTPVGSAWGPGGVQGMVSPPEPVEGSEDTKAKKGKGKQKTLIHWG